MRMQFVLCVASAACLWSSVSCQQLIKLMSSAQMKMLHAAMDGDGDELVSFEEASNVVRELRTAEAWRQGMPIMQNMDSNKDGFLSHAELVEDLSHFRIPLARKAAFADSFASFDEDGDGLLSSDEVLPLINFMFPFQKLDSNQNGVLTLSEFRAIAAPKLTGAPAAEVAKSKAESKVIFVALDADSDGRLSGKEHYTYESGIYAGLAALRKLFELSDTTGDGLISADEMVECRSNQQFGGSAAYHHSQDWINRIEQVVRAAQQQQQQAKGKGKAEL
uniref:EF-hand domain-containing protein n=1 Tax=Haptolina ericina TaxID=156174 RepID=A0A7S3B448_9EUKA|mmetsp:Transcript_46671/g.105235  ORF Transcript_46671/g.105235 Transcript_46671/m.105235 type:complete len:277 (+) Transcript_46671:61-891(+)